MLADAIKKDEVVQQAPRKTKLFSERLVTVSNDEDDQNQRFKEDTESNLQNVATTATTMSSSISDIMDNFNQILNMGGIQNFSATLESVPAVGILNGTIQYMSISLGDSGTQQGWALLDNLPATPAGTDTVSLFSFNGSFFVAVGSNVWQKTPKAAQDPTLYQAATDNWANIFNPGWVSLGACIPANDSKCIARYNQVASDGTVKVSALVRLASDGSLSWASGPVGVNMNFQTLAPTAGAAPVLNKIAYWNGSVWGYDTQNMLYEIKPVVSGGGSLTGYVLGQTIQLDGQILDMTAIDTGLVVLGSDGFLYQFIINPPKDQNSPPTTSLDKWVAQSGVTNLGAADPGVILDLRTLTTYLKSQYVTTQTSLFPYINQIQGFCASHTVYLGQLLQAAKDWQAATTPEAKQQIAANEGQVAVQHAQVMGQLLSLSLKAADQMVVAMTRQTSQINSSIKTQLVNIQAQIDTLNGTLTDLEDRYSELTAGIWASIGAVIVGIGLAVAGFFFPPAAPFLWVAAGAMVVGGVVGVGVLSSTRGKLQSAIASTTSQIAALTSSKTQLTVISQSFGDLTENYSNLDAFWTQMLSASGSISSLESLGTYILADQSSIVAAQGFNQTISASLTQYVQVLGRQGILPPTLTPDPPANFASMDVRALVHHVQTTHVQRTTQVPAQLELVTRLMDVAREKLVVKDYGSYLSTMRKAIDLNAVAHNLLLA